MKYNGTNKRYVICKFTNYTGALLRIWVFILSNMGQYKGIHNTKYSK